MAGTSVSPGLAVMIEKAAAAEAFAEARDLLEVLAGVTVTGKRVERAAEAGGAALAARVRDRAAPISARKLVPLPRSPPPDMLYGVIDGTGCPMTARETAGREGKGEDGRARTREVKLAVFFNQARLNDEGYPVRDRASSSYIAGFETAGVFADLVKAEAIRRDAEQVRQLATVKAATPSSAERPVVPATSPGSCSCPRRTLAGSVPGPGTRLKRLAAPAFSGSTPPASRFYDLCRCRPRAPAETAKTWPTLTREPLWPPGRRTTGHATGPPGRDAGAAGRAASVLPELPRKPGATDSGGRSHGHGERRVEGVRDPVEHGDRRDAAAPFQARQGGLGHPGALRELLLGQSGAQPQFPDHGADLDRAARLLVPGADLGVAEVVPRHEP
jgi:hypothetical protein